MGSDVKADVPMTASADDAPCLRCGGAADTHHAFIRDIRAMRQHVHCNEDGDGLCCDRHMNGNPTGFVAETATTRMGRTKSRPSSSGSVTP